jgi:hypothetical protein
MPKQMHQWAKQEQQVNPAAGKMFPVFADQEKNENHRQHSDSD